MKLELATKKLFGNLTINCYVDTESENGNFYMTRRQIGEALEYKDDRSYYRIISRNKEIIGEPIIEKIAINESNKSIKKYTCNLYNIEQILKISSFTQQPKTNLLIEGLSKISGFTPTKITSRYELDFEKILVNTFDGVLDIQKQYYIDDYKVDWYILKYNIIIECDENNHSNYNQNNEKIRENYINQKLNNPFWIRFNPNSDNFNVGVILNQILKNILNKK